MSKFLSFLFVSSALFMSSLSYASQVAAVKSSVVVTSSPTSLSSGMPARKVVYLMPAKMSEKRKKSLLEFKKAKVSFAMTSLKGLPEQVDLGMNGTPVLDQGQHGSCVTFANTAAIDALLGKGDYVSQLCNLELGSYLQDKGYMPSGWDGSEGSLVLSQIRQFGFVSKENQKNKSCAGVREYPLNEQENNGQPMSLEEFKSISEGLSTIDSDFGWEMMLTDNQREHWSSELTAEKMLLKVKKVLAEKSDNVNARITIGTLLPVSHCSAGACAKYHATDDTWAVTDAIRNDDHMEVGGHEMVITGYDDNAVAIDNEGGKHRGLLILRNSWGDSVGDKGNYYMTYEFFKWFVNELQKVYFVSDVDNNSAH